MLLKREISLNGKHAFILNSYNRTCKTNTSSFSHPFENIWLWGTLPENNKSVILQGSLPKLEFNFDWNQIVPQNKNITDIQHTLYTVVRFITHSCTMQNEGETCLGH
jgi:hypothetical protein